MSRLVALTSIVVACEHSPSPPSSVSPTTETDSPTSTATSPIQEARCEVDETVQKECTAGVAALVGSTFYGELQLALDEATDGATVWVCPGTWPAQLLLHDRDLSVVAVDPTPNATILTAQSDGRAVTVIHSRLVLQGLTLVEGAPPRAPGSSAALFAEEDDVDAGGGLLAHSSIVEIRCSTFRDNHAAHGGGLWADWSALLLDDVTFADNQADLGGGANISASGRLTPAEPTSLEPVPSLAIDDSTFVHNLAREDGAGLWLDGYATLSGSHFEGNEASPDDFGNGGALHAELHGTLGLMDTWFVVNEAHSGGAASVSFRQGATLTVSGGGFTGNTAVSGAAVLGWIYAKSPTTPYPQVRLEEVEVTGNVAATGGAALEGWSFAEVLGLQLVDVDLGDATNDNTPDDVSWNGTFHNGTGATTLTLP
ncbi:MAG: hypothetical protein KTR31_18640 [Myxococcales bacterium]|nr:hypothetical protein [Myxococcales bacterium]